LCQIQIEHDILPVEIDETCLQHESADACAMRLALHKARVAHGHAPEAIIIGSDTLVTLDGMRLGKPEHRVNALQMLELLSGRVHEVVTGVAVIRQDQEISCVNRTKVTFRDLSASEINAYWETGEPVDKAGAYAIQGIAARFVEKIEGSYSGVMGLPLYETAHLLEEVGVRFSVPSHA
jgi:septum formation protein